MRRAHVVSAVSATFLFGLLGGWLIVTGAEQSHSELRSAAGKQLTDGNYRDAYEVFRQLVVDPENGGETLAQDLAHAVLCLRNLQQDAEIDALLEQAITAHAKDWRVYWAAAEQITHGRHDGVIVAGEFRRGDRRGGGEHATSFERDRSQALIWLDAARRLIPQDVAGPVKAHFYDVFAETLMLGRPDYRAWQLQALTSLEELPEYDLSHRGWWASEETGAPVHPDGTPLYYSIPDSFAAAASDGERWRWCLEEIGRLNPSRRDEVDFRFANFLRSQFGVQTLQRWGILLPRSLDETETKDDPATQIVALRTLAENETIARLASGVKRFTLPDEYDFIGIYRRLAAERGSHSQASLELLAAIFQDRQQYSKAADVLRDRLERFGNAIHIRQQLEQIVGNWGQFEPVPSQPAGRGASVEYRFRNGNTVSFEAHSIRIDQLLKDIKQYLTSKPNDIDWRKLNVEYIGHRLVRDNESKYLGERVAQWDLKLEPRDNHFDRRVTVTTPLQKAGAYLVTAKIADGNTSRIILWLDDTAIVKKPAGGRILYYIADAITGRPISGANVEFFGWKTEYIPNPQNVRRRQDYRLFTSNLAEFSDDNGFVLADPKLVDPSYRWMAIARTKDGRLAHLGFSHVWYGDYQREASYQDARCYVVSDRPVYRPQQTVKFKFWLREVRYDKEEGTRFANRSFSVLIHDPEGTEIFRKDYTSDEYGGIVGEYQLAEDAKLGQYTLSIQPQDGISGGGSFRVEEYKKPEFEVTVDAPEKPLMLGDKISATIKAKYYFGAPVTEATVKLKVERTSREVRWYPYSPWDWLYGEGYWWFQPDYRWYRGFARWGCFAPIPPWWNWSPDPPELVLQQEVEIGPDGTAAVEIDTMLAKALHPDQDHEYTITAEVTDASRRTIVGRGTVTVARRPFNVFVWTSRGYYRAGESIDAHLFARTADGKPVRGTGMLKLLKITYDAEGQPIETAVQQWEVATDEEGRATQQMEASASGQYRLSCTLTAAGKDEPKEEREAIEGGYIFLVRGENFDGSEFRFNDLELIADRQEYAPGEQVELLINTDRRDSTVLVFLRPVNGDYAGPPQVLRISGKSTSLTLPVSKSDMPNFFVEALTISDGDVHTAVREIAVPPEKRIVNVDVVPSQEDYLPGQEAKVQLKLTGLDGEPIAGSLAMTMYDRAVEYISGGSNVPEIRRFFWSFKRHHHPQTEENLSRYFTQLLKDNEIPMGDLGVFGGSVADFERTDELRLGGAVQRRQGTSGPLGGLAGDAYGGENELAAPSAMPSEGAMMEKSSQALADAAPGAGPGEAMVAPTVRTQFADTAYWNGLITADENGLAEVSLTMPENLTGWKIRTWAMGEGTRVGEGTAEVTTSKNVIVRLQAPRFFVETDEVVLSAVVHNYLATPKQAQVELVLEGRTLEKIDRTANPHPVTIPANGEVRVDWRCKAVAEGTASITMKALTDEESDAMQMTFPVYVHGFLKTESYSGVVRAGENDGRITIDIPADRRPEQSRLELRYSPTLAGAMVDALPYLVDYPYGCTEQTLNRFLPTVITQNILKRMNLDLAAIRVKRTNLNAQQIGDDRERAKDWRRATKDWHHGMANPVFDEEEVARMVKQGVRDLTAMQLTDGGWGWFSGWGEHSYPHTTAVVVHGLQIAQQNGVALVPGVMDRGVQWLEHYQNEQVKLLQRGEEVEGNRSVPDTRSVRDTQRPFRTQAGDVDALVFMVLCDAGKHDAEMQRFLYRDRLKLSLYSQALFGLALHKVGAVEQRDRVVRNLDQFLKVDNENQTAYLDLPSGNYWWYWYGSDIEANAFYLKLLTAVNPQDPRASGLVKYLLNNRRHGSYWNSTRDTAYCIEAMADYLIASGEAQPNMTVEVWMDGELKQSVAITPENLFSFDNSFVLEGEALTSGEHTIELRKKPLGDGGVAGPLYFNAYLTNFSTEDFITSAGLEIKVRRTFYKLVQKEGATDRVQGSRGQVVNQQALKYDRVELENLSEVTSGDLIEVELEIDSKNDYEYVVFEDFKPAGCEPVELRSGYTRGGLGAYVEFRDEKVAFFLRELARGKHSVSYRLRAEVPGRFSALPTGGYAMYAPELKANSDEMKLRIADPGR